MLHSPVRRDVVVAGTAVNALPRRSAYVCCRPPQEKGRPLWSFRLKATGELHELLLVDLGQFGGPVVDQTALFS